MSVGPVTWMETEVVSIPPPPVRGRVTRITSCDSFRLEALGIFVPNPSDPDNSHLDAVDAVDEPGNQYVFFVDEHACRVQIVYDFTPTANRISLSTYARIGAGFEATAVEVP